ncbi:hypothetical protein HDU76_011536 [Blyttiomyces sp. JEL0837]|nr:hypothetical protein HDU76_011536 [Blyttiomyces sp. JEL0837]
MLALKQLSTLLTLTLIPTSTLAGGMWAQTDQNSFDHVDNLVWGGIWNYDLKGHYDLYNASGISWRQCVYWAKEFGNEVHAFSYDTVYNGCWLKQLPYNPNILSAFGGSPYEMSNAYVDSRDFALRGFYNGSVPKEQCNHLCDNDPTCFSAEYDFVNHNCETRTLIKANGIFFTLPWWNQFPQMYPGIAPPTTLTEVPSTSPAGIPTLTTSAPGTNSTSGVSTVPTTASHNITATTSAAGTSTASSYGIPTVPTTSSHNITATTSAAGTSTASSYGIPTVPTTSSHNITATTSAAGTSIASSYAIPTLSATSSQNITATSSAAGTSTASSYGIPTITSSGARGTNTTSSYGIPPITTSAGPGTSTTSSNYGVSRTTTTTTHGASSINPGIGLPSLTFSNLPTA